MKTEWDYRIILSDEQQATIDKAIELLAPFDKESVSYGGYYFESVDEDGDKTDDLDLMDYDCCNNVECAEKTEKELQSEYPEQTISMIYWDNNSDHENIDSCYQCGRPTNGSLTWIKQEFEHHQEHSTNIASITESRNAFDIRVMLQSFPSNDYDIGGYALHQDSLGNPEPLQKSIKYRDDFVNEVLEFANNIIKTLSLSIK